MSIRGIDSQIMVTRSADFVHEANALLKGAEKMQDFIAVQKQSDVEHEKASVAQADKSSEVKLHLEDEGGNGGEAYTSQQNKKEDHVSDEYMELLDYDVGPSEHTVDMML